MSSFCCSESQHRVMACARPATVTSSNGCYDDRRKQNSYIRTLSNR